MKKQIYRGKSYDDKKWVYGDLIHTQTKAMYILPIELEDLTGVIDVMPETVGQLTTHELGLYVGDIVNYVAGNPKYYVNAVVEFGEYETYTHFDKEEGDVEQHIGFYINDGKSKIPIRSLWIEKIGNIHDNPELLQSL
jgi:hypothetical protein